MSRQHSTASHDTSRKGNSMHAEWPGDLDESYANNGRFSDAAYDHVGPIHQTDEGLIITSAPRTKREVSIMRLDINGRKDQNFGNNGLTKVQVDDATERLRLTSVVLDSRGKILVLGYVDVAVNKQPFALRLKANGQADDEFGEAGRPYRIYVLDDQTPQLRARPAKDNSAVRLKKKYQSEGFSQGAAQILGDIVYFTTGNYILAIDSTGGLDLNFHGTGYWHARDDNGDVMWLGAIAVSKGKLAVSINPPPNEEGHLNYTFVLRMNDKGEIDRKFADNGYLRINGKELTLMSNVLKPYGQDGTLMLVCQVDMNYVHEGIALASILPQGCLDPKFNGGELLSVEKQFPGDFMYCTGICFPDSDSKSKICLAYLYETCNHEDCESDDAEWEEPFATMRINGNGTMDQSYGDSGRAVFKGSTGASLELALQSDGKLMVGSNLKLRGETRTSLGVLRLRA